MIAQASPLQIPKQAPWSLVLAIIAGIGAHFAGNFWESTATPPKEAVIYELWHTPQARVVPSIYFDPGTPTVSVSMEQFTKLVEARPYLVTYDQQWLVPQKPDVPGPSSIVTYLVKTGDVYYRANDMIPWRHYDGWYMQRTFDGTKYFSSSVLYRSEASYWLNVFLWACVPGVLFIGWLTTRKSGRR